MSIIQMGRVSMSRHIGLLWKYSMGSHFSRFKRLIKTWLLEKKKHIELNFAYDYALGQVFFLFGFQCQLNEKLV